MSQGSEFVNDGCFGGVDIAISSTDTFCNGKCEDCVISKLGLLAESFEMRGFDWCELKFAPNDIADNRTKHC